MITAVGVVFISMFISVIENCSFFMDVNSYVGKKVDLTWLDRVLNMEHFYGKIHAENVHQNLAPDLVFDFAK